MTACIPYMKPVPALADLLSTTDKRAAPKAQTMEEQISIATAWTAAIQAQPK